MLNFRMLKSILGEYGISWAINRGFYNVKLKTMCLISGTERLFEKRVRYPKKLNLFQIDVEALRNFICELDKHDKNALVKVADEICDGRIEGFSSILLDYGSPIDWQLNPLTGMRCNESEKWYRISDFDQNRGDIKGVWEASRFSHFVTLARAYLLTNDKKYYKAFSKQLSSWLEKNPYSYGANFKCGQECSIRMVNALLAYTIFCKDGVADNADAENVKELINRCYRKVLSNFFYAYRCIKNNHTISELMGMIVGAWCCEDQRRLKKSYTLLNKVIDEQFTSDGGYRQFSFNYQRLALQALECILSIEGTVGKSISNICKEKLKNAALLMYQCQDESGDMPNYGANDGALIFPVTSCGYRDFKAVINTVHALITGKQIYKKGKHQEELIWFSGGKVLQDYREETIDRKSMQFPTAGLVTLRNENSWAMIVLNEYKSRPAHMDQLHVDLWVGGINVFCDAGTYSYASDVGRQFTRNESHNTVVVTGTHQMNGYGPFMIYDWTRREFVKSNDNSFEGKIISKNGYSHIRRVNLSEGMYEITDFVDKAYSVCFHTVCEVSLEDGKAILSYGGKRLCELSSTGRVDLLGSERSLYYLRKENTNCILIGNKNEKKIKTTIRLLKESEKHD